MMENKITMRKGYVRTDGWRGYSQPIFAVAGANDTGGWEDSPCPSDLCKKELDALCADLKHAGIKFKRTYGETSNVFCIHRYVVVSKVDHARAYEIADQHIANTRLLYKCEILSETKEKA